MRVQGNGPFLLVFKELFLHSMLCFDLFSESVDGDGDGADVDGGHGGKGQMRKGRDSRVSGSKSQWSEATALGCVCVKYASNFLHWVLFFALERTRALETEDQYEANWLFRAGGKVQRTMQRARKL